MSRAACMPAMPPPTTRVLGFTENLLGLEVNLIRDPHQPGPDQDDGLGRGLVFALRHPGAVFPDTDLVEGPVGVQPRPLAGGPEGLLVHAG